MRRKLWVKINEKIATHITLAFGTMWCTYLFLIIAIIPLFAKSTTEFIIYLSSGVIQLVALPLISVGQNYLNRASESRARNDHLTLLKQFNEIKKMTIQQNEALADLKKIIASLDQIKKHLK